MWSGDYRMQARWAWPKSSTKQDLVTLSRPALSHSGLSFYNHAFYVDFFCKNKNDFVVHCLLPAVVETSFLPNSGVTMTLFLFKEIWRIFTQCHLVQIDLFQFLLPEATLSCMCNIDGSSIIRVLAGWYLLHPLHNEGWSCYKRIKRLLLTKNLVSEN